ncbi:MAG: PSD1 and planctomycete cytochrome C domain-containing protein [Planctomycetota bacterium]
MIHRLVLSFVLSSLLLPALIAEDETSRAALLYFESEIRPLLARECYSCHSARAKEVKGGLRLDTRAGLLRGGESGAAVAPGDPAASLLFKAVRYQDLEMPPRRRLSARDVAKLEKWIRIGAPFPKGSGEEEPAPAVKSARRKRLASGPLEITDEDRNYWAYLPLDRSPAPRVSQSSWVQSGLDAYVLSKLEEKKLTPNPPASARTLIRRLYFDLVGYPPSLSQIDSFAQSEDPARWPRLIDELLASPRYGERWGRHWLDVVRFAQSNGYERDDEKPLAWRYRDYVIDAFNADLPFDRFVTEQLAGDEIEDGTASSIAATGFYRLGVWDDEPDDKRQAEYDGLDDMLSTIGQVFLGQTLGCARCHNHMFDPIPQSDYYELLAFLRGVRYYERPDKKLGSATFAPLASRKELARWKAERDRRIQQIDGELKKLSGEANKERRKPLEEKLKRAREVRPPFEWTLAVSERDHRAPDTHLLVRGNPATPGKKVEPRFLAVFGNGPAQVRPLPADIKSSGRRLTLARWMTSEKNPLAARVIVNRVWQHHFGRGIARTPNDLGRAGLRPTHPQLLDDLASRLIDSDWSIKRLHREILLSSTYQMSSKATNATAAAIDPGNDLFWRQNMRRLDAESIRDSVLVVANRMNHSMGGRGFFPHVSGEVVAGLSKPGRGWDVSSAHEQLRRSVYIFVKRGVRDPLIEAFDYGNTAQPLGVRPITTVAPQALILLNSRFVVEQADAIAEAVERKAGASVGKQVREVYRRLLGREAREREVQVAIRYLESQRREFRKLSSHVSFYPDVPSSLFQGYRRRLNPEHYLFGPRGNWVYHRGIWGGGYEQIDVAEVERGPFALWKKQAFAELNVSGSLFLQPSAERASLIVQAQSDGDTWKGIEVALDPRKSQIVLTRRPDQGTKRVVVPFDVPRGVWSKFRLEASEKHLSFWLGESRKPVLRVEHETPQTAGYFGVSAWRGQLSFNEVAIESKGRVWDLARETERRPDTQERMKHHDKTTAQRAALRALAQIILNLNEFVYVD